MSKIASLWARYRDVFFPESLLVGTPWQAEWEEQQRSRLVRISRIFFPISGAAWLAHIWLVDIPQNKPMLSTWITIRVAMFTIAMIAWAAMYVPRVSKGRYYWVPWAVVGFIYSVTECYCLSLGAQIILMIPLGFVLFHTVVMRFNPVWSLLYALSIFVAAWPFLLQQTEGKASTLYSYALITLIFVYFTRSHMIEEIRAFLNVRQLVEAQKRIAEEKEKVLKKELELTAAVQSLLLPAKTQDGDGRFTLVGKNIPASQCGGDWWWHHRYGDKLRILLADVTGHGAGPAMVTASVSSFTKVLYDPAKPFSELLENLKSHYFDYFVESNYWMTLTGCEVDLNTGKICAWFAGAPPIICMNSASDIEEIGEAGSPLGSDPTPFGYAESRLEPGGKLILMTDGMTEAKRAATGSEIGLRRVKSVFREKFAFRGESFVNSFFDYVSSERGALAQDDDYTFIAIDMSARS